MASPGQRARMPQMAGRRHTQHLVPASGRRTGHASTRGSRTPDPTRRAAKRPRGGSLPTLLHVRLDEVLGVRLEDLVDLVEEVVELRLELLAGSVSPAARSSTTSSVVVGAWPLLLLTFGHVHRSSRPHYARAVEEIGGGVAAIDQAYPRGPPVPRSGSIMGTRRSGSRPTSNTSESQLAATMSSATSAGTAPEVGPGVGRRLGHRGHRLVDQTIAPSRPGRQRLSGGGRGTGGPSPAAGRRPTEAVALGSRRRGAALAIQSTWRPRTRDRLEPGEHLLPAAQHVGTDLVADALEPVLLARTCGPARELPLDLEGRDRRPSASSIGGPGWVVGDLADRRTGLAEQQVAAERSRPRSSTARWPWCPP